MQCANHISTTNVPGLSGLLWTECLVYLDDVIVLGATFEEHIQALQAVLSCIRVAGLKLKLSNVSPKGRLSGSCDFRERSCY